MKQVSLYEAKTHLSRLVDEAAAGEEIVIAKNGKPMARLRPLDDTQAKKEPRKLGQWAQQNKHIDWDKWWRDWKAADKEFEADFEAAIGKPFPGESEDTSLASTHEPKRRRGFAESGSSALAKGKRTRGKTRRPRSKPGGSRRR
jgi:prevent-host-death family protein